MLFYFLPASLSAPLPLLLNLKNSFPSLLLTHKAPVDRHRLFLGLASRLVIMGDRYGVTCVIRVAQFPNEALVPPQLPNGAEMYWLKVHV